MKTGTIIKTKINGTTINLLTDSDPLLTTGWLAGVSAILILSVLVGHDVLVGANIRPVDGALAAGLLLVSGFAVRGLHRLMMRDATSVAGTMRRRARAARAARAAR